MALKALTAGICAAALAALAYASAPADAQQKKKTAGNQTKTVMAGKPRARIRVAPRSFLDTGTESMPGDHKYMDYALPPTYSPLSVIDNTAFNRRPYPTGPFDLPGKNNPWPWGF